MIRVTIVIVMHPHLLMIKGEAIRLVVAMTTRLLWQYLSTVHTQMLLQMLVILVPVIVVMRRVVAVVVRAS
jgi:hypothetical protein